MFKKEAAALCHTPAFGPAHTMHGFNKHDVLGNIRFADELNIFLMMILKQQSHLLQVASNGTLAIIANLKSNV